MSDTSNVRYFDNTGREIPYDSLSDSTKHYLEIADQVIDKQNYRERHQSQGSYFPVAVIIGIFVVIAYTLIKKVWQDKSITILPGSRDRTSTAYQSLIRRQQLLKDYLVYEGCNIDITEEQLQNILSKRSPYYRRLAPDQKEKFLHRTKRFLASKTFLLKTNDPFIEMPLLISATAVQLTFGLDNYMLPHFQYIRIYPEEYFANGTLKVLAGHVYGNTITLSWNYFLKGHEDYTDGINLGLHEMAHALYFQVVHGDMIKSRRFVSNFNEVMAEGTEVYEQKRTNPSKLFAENAYRNLQEFWAESTEVFFERPAELKSENAELFKAISEMLNQDPVNGLYPVVD